VAAQYKVLGENRQAYYGGSGGWAPNRWRSAGGGRLEPCKYGIHFCGRDQLVMWLGPQIWVFEDGSPDETIDAGDKLVTRRGRVVLQLETWNARSARLFATDCAESVLDLIPRARRAPFANAVRVARAFARGEATDQERHRAWVATSLLSRSSDAAYNAAVAASYSVTDFIHFESAEATAQATAKAMGRPVDWAPLTEILFDYLEGRRR
jgi:hypothetical protein